MAEQAGSLSIIELFLHADIVVKGVLLLLLAASIWSWAVIIEKLRQLGIVSRRARACEERAETARGGAELAGATYAASDGPAGLVLAAGTAETATAPIAPESAGERRERI